MVRKPILLSVSRRLATVHRWLGIALGLVFALWFASGTILSFVPFPSLGRWERIAGAERISVDKVQVSAATAVTAAGNTPIDQLRLISVEGQPRYVLSLSGHPLVSVSAVSGKLLDSISSEDARNIAERFSALEAARVEGPFDYDQWTVHNGYDPYRPLYRLSMHDQSGTELYVSSRSGEVVQRTNRWERAWNWVGAVVHWINPTILRKHEAVWHATVWSLALVAMVVPLAGIWLGLVRVVNLRRSGRPGISPFKGWLRWHHTIGLFGGIFVLSWVTSGWLSLDQGRIFSSDQPSLEQKERLRGISLASAAKAFPLNHLQGIAGSREIEFSALGGHPLLIMRDGNPRSSAIDLHDDVGIYRISPMLPDELLLAAVKSAWSPSGVLGISGIPSNDTYAGPRSNPLPASARRIALDDASRTWVHIDAESGRIIGIMDTSRRAYRWLVDGLHTFDFPLLNEAGALWHVLLVMATTTGFLLSCTAIVLTIKRLGRMRR
ncbi:MAG: PepSY domain-containing protein [Proteobacteria bacterium]|nr:PepSY domain-containing protein [Pseudomonadota bacterium]